MTGEYEGYGETVSAKNGFRGVCGRIGLTMLFHTLLIYLLFWLNYFLDAPLRAFADAHAGIFGAYAADIASGCSEAVAYLLSFMLPVAFFRLISVRRNVQPMRLGVRFSSNTAAWIVFAVAATVAASCVNYWIVRFAGVPSYEGEELPNDAVGIIISFMCTALVPAICEEFLFRSCILSNLLPYGKSAAIIGSAVLFALMHNNVRQFFYTAVAGLILGWVYVETRSVWTCTFIHLFNNAVSVFMPAFCDRFHPAASVLISCLFDAVLLAAGVAAGAFLINSRAAERKSLPTDADCNVCERGNLRGFFTPAMIVYFALALILAVLNI